MASQDVQLNSTHQIKQGHHPGSGNCSCECQDFDFAPHGMFFITAQASMPGQQHHYGCRFKERYHTDEPACCESNATFKTSLEHQQTAAATQQRFRCECSQGVVLTSACQVRVYSQCCVSGSAVALATSWE